MERYINFLIYNNNSKRVEKNIFWYPEKKIDAKDLKEERSKVQSIKSWGKKRGSHKKMSLVVFLHQ